MSLTYKGLNLEIPYEVIQVEDLDIIQALNEHVYMKAKFLIEEKKVSDYINKDATGEKVTVKNKEGNLFVGKISKVHISYDNGLNVLEIHCVSFTKDFDLKKKSRTFCNLDMTYNQVINKTLETYSKKSFIDNVTEGKQIGELILQYEETDWEFLKRIATHFNGQLLADATVDYGRFHFGLPKINNGKELTIEDYKVVKDIHSYNINEAMNIGENFLQEYTRWDIVTDKKLALGEQVLFNKIKCAVVKIHTEVYKEQLRTIYTLSIERGVRTLYKTNEKIFGMSIPAIVKDVKGNTMSVHFEIDEVFENCASIKYFTFAIESSSWYCMPEVDSKVHIYFPTNDEKSAIAIHAVRSADSSAQFAKRTVNPDDKSFSNTTGSEMKLTPSDMTFAADDAQSVSMKLSESGDVSITGQDITFSAAEDMQLGMRNSDGELPPFRPEKVKISAKNKLQLVKGGTAMINMSDATFLKAAKITYVGTVKSPATIPAEIANRNAKDDQLIAEHNGKVKDEMKAKIDAAKSKFGFGVFAAVIGAVAIGVAVVATGGLALVAVAAVGATAMAVGVAEMSEASQDYTKAQSGDESKSFNFMRDGVCRGNETLYNIVKYGSVMIAGISVAVITGPGALQVLGKIAADVFQDTAMNLVMDFLDDGKINNGWESYVKSAVMTAASGGLATGSSNMINKLEKMKKLSCKNLGRLRIATDVAIDSLAEYGTTGETNIFANIGQKYISNKLFIADPVDAVTGSLYIPSTDIVLPDIHEEFKIERKYNSTNNLAGVMGKGWVANFETFLNISGEKVEVICADGHLEIFNQIDGQWVNDKGGAKNYTLARLENQWIFKNNVEKKTYKYDNFGKLVRITDRYENNLYVTYINDHIETITTFSGYKLFFTYKDDKIIEIKDELGRTVQYKYHEDYLTDVIHVDQGITRYTYDDKGYISSITDQNGKTYTKNFFDKKGRVIKQDYPNGDGCDITYDDSEREVTLRYRESGRIERSRYNKNLLITDIFYEDGTFEHFDYDKYENKIYEKDRNGFETYRTYNEAGSVIKESLPNGLVKEFSYDEEENLIKEWDNAGKEILHTYDNKGKLIKTETKISVSQWKTEEFTYDSYGRILTKTDGNGNTSRYEYELGGKIGKDPIKVITNSNYQYIYQYDEVGRNTEITTDYGTIEFGYNSLDYVTYIKDGNGNITRKDYDKMGNLVSLYPPNGCTKDSNGEGYHYSYDYMDRLTSIKNPLGIVEKSIRDSEGNIIKEVNPNYYDSSTEDGLGIEYVYDKDNRKIKTIYPDGGVERFFYDANGNVIKHVSPEYYNAETDDGIGYSYDYDGMNRLIFVINEEGVTEKVYEYDLHGNISKEIDAEGNEILFKYDLVGNLIEKRTPTDIVDGEIKYNLTCYAYDNNSNKILEKHGTTLIAKNGVCNNYHEIYFEYDKENRLIEVKDKYGAKARYKYDCLNNKTYESFKINDTTEKIIHYSYDKVGNLIEKKEEIDGKFLSPKDKGKNIWAVTKYQYDRNGNITKIITPKGYEIERIYDVIDRVIEEYEADSTNGIFRSKVFSYDKADNLTKLSEYSGENSKLIHKKFLSENDINLKLIERVNNKRANKKLFEQLNFKEDEKAKIYKYDVQNRLTHFINALGNTTRLFYDKNDRIIKQVAPEQYDEATDDGLGTTYKYNLKGQVVEVKNPLGETQVENIYDIKGNLKASIDGERNKVEYNYTLLGQIKDISTPNSKKENKVAQSYSYDARGNITGIIDGNGNSTSYLLDDWGRIIQITTPEGGVEKYTYDYAGNITSTTDANGGKIEYYYNSLGQVSEIKDQEGNSEYFYYDEEGNLTKRIDRNSNEVDTSYNLDRNIVSLKAYNVETKNSLEQWFNYNPDGTLNNAYTGNMRYDYSYTLDGNLESKKASGKTLISYTYDKNDNIKSIKDITGKTSSYSYDNANRLKEITDENSSKVVEYSYNKNDDVTSITYGNGIKTNYTYDGDGNVQSLVTITSTGEVLVDYNYAYDLNGNRLEKVSSKHKNYYTYDSMNRLKDASYDGRKERFTYDKVGNRLTKTTNDITEKYVYNVKNQLKELHNKNGINYFTYDRQGNTIKEETTNGNNFFEYNTLNQQIKAITKDGNTLVSRYDTEGLRAEIEENEKLTKFIFHRENVLVETDKDYNSISRFVRGYEVVAADTNLEAKTNRYYYAQDEQGSTIVITDNKQNVKNEYYYDAFGNVLDSKEEVHNRITYTGQQFDKVTQQYYLRARFYNPVIGRFIQEDTYRGDGLNLYAYCKANPIKYYDPSGYSKDRINIPGDYNFIGPVTNSQLQSYYSNVRAYQGDVDITKIPVECRANPNTIIEMEFKGKASNKSGRNAAGWERKSSKYFKELSKIHPEYFSEDNMEKIKNNRVPVIDDQYLKHLPEYKNYQGDELRHHHVGEGGQACALPLSEHKGYGGVHNYEKEAGVTGNDPLTVRAQAMEEGTRDQVSKNKKPKKCRT